ncbi:AsnC family transcriptional regulator (plasmid) [Natrinema zhouii]|uniref:AsnC family transcriptional regulator n=1 Tax=Natrinema zhouii TaxID=1710539 RepID=UPI001CFFE29F|nr:AsnC family transcriptional regulator [Natrinema zhouii]UHQ99251.1 AsnC family transcriptional regulator [Natrinema zhouii]
MRDLDETDMEILTLLGENARRPFSDIGKAIGLSGPAVSDRVTRFQEVGIINRFTIDVDRSQLHAVIPVFVQVSGASKVNDLKDRIGNTEAVEHVFVTADGGVWFYARAQVQNVRRWLDELLGTDGVDYTVTLMDIAEWRPSLDGTEFALTCAECSNTVDNEGRSARIDGQVYHFCCPSCQTRFQDRYD